MKVPLAGLALILAAPAVADSNQPAAPYAYRQLKDPQQEARAKALMEELRCLVCQGQSIADSDAELAGDMRSLVRERIAAGESPEEVRSWLVERYGRGPEGVPEPLRRRADRDLREYEALVRKSGPRR